MYAREQASEEDVFNLKQLPNTVDFLIRRLTQILFILYRSFEGLTQPSNPVTIYYLEVTEMIA